MDHAGSDGTGTCTGIPEFSTGKMRYGALSNRRAEIRRLILKVLLTGFESEKIGSVSSSVL